MAVLFTVLHPPRRHGGIRGGGDAGSRRDGHGHPRLPHRRRHHRRRRWNGPPPEAASGPPPCAPEPGQPPPEAAPATRLAPRPYQLLALAEAEKSDVIVNIATGAGKTFIATLVLDRVCLAPPARKKALFIVHTAALVPQQAKSIARDSAHGATVRGLVGGEVDFARLL